MGLVLMPNASKTCQIFGCRRVHGNTVLIRPNTTRKTHESLQIYLDVCMPHSAMLIEAMKPEPVKKSTVATKKRAKAIKAEPLYTWAFKSAKPQGGQIIDYISRLNEDGSVTCNCPGWIFCKTKEARECKHTRQVVDEAKSLFGDFKAGDMSRFTIYDEGGGSTGATFAAINAPKAVDSSDPRVKPKYGRVILI